MNGNIQFVAIILFTCIVGNLVGITVGTPVGIFVGITVGFALGFEVGALVLGMGVTALAVATQLPLELM